MAISSSKLDLLMNLTGTSNGELGQALSFDTSYISRIRAGKRGIPRHQPFVEPAACYFVEKLAGDSTMQNIVAFLISKDTPWPADRETAIARLAEWLSFDIGDGYKVIESFIRNFSEVHIPEEPMEVTTREPPTDTVKHFLGNAGRRQAMERFLGELLGKDAPEEVLYYTDEDTSWITEDPEFLDFWWCAWLQYLQNGGHLCLIHTANRGQKEVLTEVQFYLPLYMTGGITPYFCPILLDRIFCRTMFVQPGRTVILGQTIGPNAPIRSTFLERNPDSVRAVEEDYRSFQRLCMPLMRVLDPAKQKDLDELQFFYSSDEPHTHMGRAPLLGTLPESVIMSMERRSHDPNLTKQLLGSKEMFYSKLEAGIAVTEILNLPTIEEIHQGMVVLPFSAALGSSTILYEPAEFLQQLIEVTQVLERYPNYHITLTDRMPDNVDIFSTESTTLLVRLGVDGRAFYIQNRTADSFWHYLRHLRGQVNREIMINTLKDMIAELESK